eukprot:1747840-Heterocapsa_arctica.AAC.1
MVLTPPGTAFNDDFYAADAWSEHPDFATDGVGDFPVPDGEAGADSGSEDDSDDSISAEPIDEMGLDSDVE